MSKNYKYEVASESYSFFDGEKKLVNVPQQVAMYDTYEEAINNHGQFIDGLLIFDELEINNVNTLYKLTYENGDVIKSEELGYQFINN